MTFLPTADCNFLLGRGPKVVKAEPMLRRQGNGKFSGEIVTTYDDGSQGVRVFIQNAATAGDVRAAYATCGA
jgi:hypothetical protein